MTEGPTRTGDGLPPVAAEQLRAVARARTEGPVPYPRLATAIRRDRRRRAASGVAIGVAALLTATFVTSAVRDDRPTVPSNRGTGPTPTQTQTPSPTPSRTPEAGPDGDPYQLAGRTAGALGSDADWITGMRQRVAVAERGRAAGPAHVKVLWAADLEGGRYAATIAQKGTTWTIEEWAGPPGAAPAAMSYEGGAGGTSPGLGARPVIQPWFRAFPPPGDGRGSAVLVAVGDRLSDVEVGTDVDYLADGRKTATWRPLEPQAAVWVGEASAAELAGDLTVRVRGSDGRRRPAVGRGAPPPQVPLPPGMADVAPPGTDLDVLTCAAAAFAPFAGGMPRDATPVLGGVQQVDLEYYGVAVARAKGGGYLVGSCPTLQPEGAMVRDGDNPQGFVVPAPAGGPDDLFALLPSTWTEAWADEGAPGGIRRGEQNVAAVVVAPVGATVVDVAGQTVPVRDRLAVVRDVPEEGVTAIAHDAAGRELARTGLARTEREVESASFFDVS